MKGSFEDVSKVCQICDNVYCGDFLFELLRRSFPGDVFGADKKKAGNKITISCEEFVYRSVTTTP